MSMWRTSVYRSPCEVLREINDLFQGDTEMDKRVRKLLADAESKAKDMSMHLTVHEKNYSKKWEVNKDSNRDVVFRTRSEYKYHKI